MAFVQGELKLLLLDGSGITTVSGAATWEYLAWSPDGTRLAASGTDTDGLWVFDAAGNEVSSALGLVERGFPEEETLLWSPNGASVLYRADYDGNSAREVRVLDAATGDVTEVSDAPAAGRLRFVGWSFDGAWIAYVANEDQTATNNELLVVRPDGTERDILSLADESAVNFGSTPSFRWAPDVNELIYTAKRDADSLLAHIPAEPEDLAKRPLDDDGRTELTTADEDIVFEWSPAGSRIAFIADGELHTVDTDAGNDVTLSSEALEFEWSPTGADIAYREGPGGFGGGNELWAADADTDDKARVSPDPVAGGGVESFGWTGAADLAFFADAEQVRRFDLYVSQVLPTPAKNVSSGRAAMLAPDECYQAVPGTAGGIIKDRLGPDRFRLRAAFVYRKSPPVAGKPTTLFRSVEFIQDEDGLTIGSAVVVDQELDELDLFASFFFYERPEQP